MQRFTIRFTLDRPSKRSFRSQLGSDLYVEVNRKAQTLLVKGVEAVSSEDAVGRALELANKVLDEATLKLNLPLTVLESPNVIEWQNEGGQKFHLLLLEERLKLDDDVEIVVVKPGGSAEVSYPADKVVEVQPSEYDCTRFFRRARAAELLHSWFEAMREYFRSIEWVVSALGRHPNSEGIAHVLRECFSDPIQHKQLEDLAKSCSVSPSEGQDLQRAVAECLYHEYRNQLAHAKALARPSYKRPFDREAENQVRQALPLAEFVAREVIKHYQACHAKSLESTAE